MLFSNMKFIWMHFGNLYVIQIHQEYDKTKNTKEMKHCFILVIIEEAIFSIKWMVNRMSTQKHVLFNKNMI